MMHRKLTFTTLALVMIAALLLSAAPPVVQAEPDAPDATYSYTNNVSYNIPDGTSTTNTGCAYWPATRYFLVDGNFTVNDLNVEFSQSHPNRGQIQMKLTAPDGTTKTLMATSGDISDNYYITIDDASANPLNDGSNDTIGGTRRTVGPSTNGDLDAFTGKNAHGHWTMTICDATYTGGTLAQAFNAATLVFDGTAITPTPPNHSQGPAVVETYFVPWPEDQVWTAMGRIFPTSCSNYASFRDNYDGAPRQPMVGYTGITIVDAGTVITYDHWEGGYEADLTYPTQNSTEVWGDGDLTNGVAPGDADDVLTAGQILILNDVMLSSTLGTIVDFDARDKIGASKPIGVTRSVWADGSQTLFAAADEVYPVDRWGTQFYAPVGDNANLNGMFDYSAVSIIAAYDGTTVDIDKDGNGTYETTGVALSQGGTTFVDDTGTGVYRGARFRSNSGHPIQVNLMEANTCAGYESRTYPLLPYDQWASSYYLPVSTITIATGPGSDDAPTTVHLYNPNAGTIYVAYHYDSGYAGCLTIATNSSNNMVMPVGESAHFYNVTACPTTTTNDVEDQFASQAYNLNTGSVNWATSWDETGDDDSATVSTGSIYINSTDQELRFNFRTDYAGLGDTIERQSYDLTGYSSATLSFDYGPNDTLEAGDVLGVSVYDGDTATWTQIATIAGNTSGTFTQDISSYISSSTRIRFSINARSGDGGSSDRMQVDNVNITFSSTTAATPGTNVFYGVASVDSDNAGGSGTDQNSTYDWGITMVPEAVMSQWVIVGWAPGDDPTFQGTQAENTAPIWLTGDHPADAADQTSTYDICVDYNGDCTSGTCTLDTATGRYYDRQVTGIAPLTQVKIYKNKVVPPDTGQGTAGDDQTGTSIWVCGPTGTDVMITAAWGADPLVCAPSKPGLDMGYTVRNQRAWRAVKSAALQVDLNGNGLYDEGDTVRYTITVYNVGGTDIPSVVVKDTFPPNMTYVANSTHLTNDGTPPPANGQIPDGSSPAFPLDDSGAGYTYTNLNRFTSFSIRFDATINPTDPFVATRLNVAHVTVGTQTVNPEVTITVQNPPVKLGTIGNYVWLDEDGDGDQDAGEAGIPNVLVTITNGTVTYTTYTDANGGYLFTDLPVGNWTVTVTPPAGLNPTYDENGINTPNVTTVNLTAGEEHLTADFGYNWSTPAETNNPGTTTDNTGAIGDHVWVDLDPDGGGPLLPNGKQDAEEIGIQGVTVGIFVDSDLDGQYDDPYDMDPVTPGVQNTTTTDANGNYIFDGLPAGAYAVTVLTPPSGYTQTGDPDHFATNVGTNDNTTTTPIVLGPGDVFVNADFGYTPTSADTGSIGDTVFLDQDGTGPGQVGPGIPGVTVSLIKDTNGNGVWEVGEPIIATDITDANGQYLFSGLPANGTEDYLVWVNDTNNVLGDLVPTYDSNGVATPNISAVTDLTPAGNLNQDFGYAPANHDAGEGLIGDTVWLDSNNNGVFDAGEGLEGVLVKLYAADGVTLVGTTTTNENGQYFFGNLNATSTYVVQVQTGTLPYSGLTNFVDPDGGNNSTSTVNLAATGPVNLLQDFGYRDTSSPNTIGGTIWTDTNADGVLAGESGWFQGVTVVLRNAAGNIVATTTTDANGNYSFTNLPDGTYTVDVTDDANVLNGYWKSNCTTGCGTDNHSQVDPYPVTVGPTNRTDTTGDFGYYVVPAGLGNFVWYDKNQDGIQVPGEPGIDGAVVTLIITYPNGAQTTLTTVTGDNPATPGVEQGWYSFGNLLQDEDYNGLGTYGTEPTYSITVAMPAGYSYASPAGVGGDRTVDSGLDSETLETVWTTQGSVNLIYDFGFHMLPLAVNLAACTAEASPDGVILAWETVSEQNNAGFNVHRAASAEGPWTQLNETLIASQAPGSSEGRSYTWTDVTAAAGTYWYMLEDVALDGVTTRHDPVSVTVTEPTAPNAVGLSTFSVATAAPSLVGLAALALAALAGAGLRRRRR